MYLNVLSPFFLRLPSFTAESVPLFFRQSSFTIIGGTIYGLASGGDKTPVCLPRQLIKSHPGDYETVKAMADCRTRKINTGPKEDRGRNTLPKKELEIQDAAPNELIAAPKNCKQVR